MSKVLEMWQGMTGTVLPFALATAPDGWMLCDGTALSSGTADNLRAKLLADGSPYGTTYDDPNLPDLRGEFVRGLDAGRGIDAGRALGSWQIDQFKAHTHNADAETAQEDASGGEKFASINNSSNDTDLKTKSSGGDETRPRNVAMNYIIKT